MKSQISGICSAINEKVDVLENAKEQIAFRKDKAQNEWIVKNEMLENEEKELRAKIQKLNITVSTLQELRDDEL